MNFHNLRRKLKKSGIIVFILMMSNMAMSQNIALNISAYLEGPFVNNTLDTTLKTNFLLPLSQPFNASPWNYQGSENLINIPAGTVDWVLINLLRVPVDTTLPPFEVIEKRAALLKFDGQIMDTNGLIPVFLPPIGDSIFFISIQHRNHLPVISATPLHKISGIYFYDFSSGPGQSFWGNATLKQLAAGKWGMKAADGDANAQIDNHDKNNIWLAQFNAGGYLSGDYNLDGQVNFDDLNLKWVNNAGHGIINHLEILSVCTANPRYFCAGGKAVYLVGSHTWDNLQDFGITFNYTDYINWMQSLDHNFMRLWAWENWYGTDWANSPEHSISPLPFLQVGTQYDLTQLNVLYFDRLKQRIQLASEKGIYVSIMLFEGFSAEHTPYAWNFNPFKGGNNVNGIAALSSDVHTGIDPVVLEAQQLYVNGVIDMVNTNHLNNVLYEIANEIPNNPQTDLWQNNMIDYIHNYEYQNYGVNRPVGKTDQYNNGNNAQLFNSPADWISPGKNSGEFDCKNGHAPISNGDKVIISDTDHFYYLWYTNIGNPVDYAWKSFTGGINAIHMDNWGGGSNVPGYLLGQSSPGLFTLIRNNMGYAKYLADRMDLISTSPQPTLSSTGFCLASDHEFVVYLPQNVNSAQVDLSTVNGQFDVEWINTSDGTMSAGGVIPGGNFHDFTSPYGDYSILYLKKIL